MKCVRCGRDCKYSERTDGRCPSCGGRFAFEPAGVRLDPVTDGAFAKAVEAVSAGGKLHFTADQLRYELCRRLKSAPVVVGTVAIFLLALAVVTGVTTAVLTKSAWAALGYLVLVPLALGLQNLHKDRVERLPRDKFRDLLGRWGVAHGAPAGLVAPATPPRPAAPLDEDVADYSFDRAVVCDRPETVDFLLANNFHFENNCAVLTPDGHPAGPFETVRAMLRRNPDLLVLVVRDCSPAGSRVARQIATAPEWFGGRVPVIDLGLTPEQARRVAGGLLERAEEASPLDTADGLPPADAQWLRRHRCELAVVRPQSLLKRLYNALQHWTAEQDAFRKTGGGALAGALTGAAMGVVLDRTMLTSDKIVPDGGGADSFG